MEPDWSQLRLRVAACNSSRADGGILRDEGSLKTASTPRVASQSARSVKVPPTSTPIARTAPPFESVECTLRPNHEGLCLRSPAVAAPLAAVLLSRPERALRPGAGHAGLRRA